nr:hypothetical protein [Maribacter vaceletii]
MKYGIDDSTHLPFHAININKKQGMGPNNWGRGMGWYMLALKSVINRNILQDDEYIDYTDKVNLFLKEINSLKQDRIYTQFPGTSYSFDSSTSTMLMYGENVLTPNKYSRKDILDIYKDYIKQNGIIDLCSGDAYGVNKYSFNFGESELSQGVLLLLLSSCND